MRNKTQSTPGEKLVCWHQNCKCKWKYRKEFNLQKRWAKEMDKPLIFIQMMTLKVNFQKRRKIIWIH